MNFFNFAAGGAILGILTACWGHLKAVSWKLISLLIQRVEISADSYIYQIVVDHLVASYKRSTIYDRSYAAQNEHRRDLDRYGYVAVERLCSGSMIFWRGWFPIFFSKSTEQKKDIYGSTTQHINASLTFLRGTIDADQLMIDAVNKRNEMRWKFEELSAGDRRRFFIKHVPDFFKDENKKTVQADSGLTNGVPWYQMASNRVLGVDPKLLGRGTTSKTSALENLIFPERIQKLIEDIKLWRTNRDWYHKRNIPWKRGWLLYGPGGTGKTALARAFAEDLDMPIFVYNMNELGNFEFMRAWTEMLACAPCIALIEDIDNVFHGRENVGRQSTSLFSMFHRKRLKIAMRQDGESQPQAQSNSPESSLGADKEGPLSDLDGWGCGRLTFDCFINMLDGIERNDGVFTIITTNHIEHIDPALGKPVKRDGHTDFVSTRPGRIDKAIELTYMENEDKLRMACKIVGDYPESMAEIIKHVTEHPDLQETPAQFQEYCSQLALKEFWILSQMGKESEKSCVDVLENRTNHYNELYTAITMGKTDESRKEAVDRYAVAVRSNPIRSERSFNGVPEHV